MNILAISPSVLPALSGNAVTVNRIARGIRKKGVWVRVVTPAHAGKILPSISFSSTPFSSTPFSSTPFSSTPFSSTSFTPDAVHLFHAYKSRVGLRIARQMRVPLAVTITGTDLNHDLLNPKRRKSVLAVLNAAAAITVFHQHAARKLVNEGIPKKRIRIIRPSVVLSKTRFNLRKKCGIPSGAFLFFLPAGLRRVKYGCLFLDVLERLHRQYGIHLVIAGTVLEPAFARRIQTAAKKQPWIHFCTIPHQCMAAAYHAADTILNTSVSEGLCNSLLEACAQGKPILASNIEGNRSIIKNNINGLLFIDEKEFFQNAEKLITDNFLRRRLGKKARETSLRFSPAGEISAYIKLYQHLIST